MSELLTNLGIDWRLLISQGANFLILLAVLTFVLWKPLLKITEERRRKIELGLNAGEEAGRRLAEIDREKITVLASAEEEALALMKKSELAAKENAEKLMAQGAARSQEIERQAAEIAERKKKQADIEMMEEAKKLVRAAIIKTVHLRPEAVDEALVEEALREIKSAA